jgi:hypothetical protein
LIGEPDPPPANEAASGTFATERWVRFRNTGHGFHGWTGATDFTDFTDFKIKGYGANGDMTGPDMGPPVER